MAINPKDNYFTDTSKAPEPKLGNKPILGERIGGTVQELPNVGDYITYNFGRESILMTKGKDQKIRAFYNVCQHRANRLVQSESGNAETFSCGYHGWQYALDGELLYVRDEEDFLQGSPCGKLRLTEIPCDIWGGFIWFNI